MQYDPLMRRYYLNEDEVKAMRKRRHHDYVDVKLDMIETIDEARALFWGAIGECDPTNQSASEGLDAAMEHVMDHIEALQHKMDAIINAANHEF